MRLQNRVDIITGAGHGIGRVYALAYVAEGATVVVADIDGPAAEAVAAELEDAGGQAIGLQSDVSDAANMPPAGAVINPQQYSEQLAERAIQRIEQPEDLVGAAIFLASGESDLMTGQTLVIDGGSWML